MRQIKGYPLEIIDLQSFEVPIASDLLSVVYDKGAGLPMLWVRQDVNVNAHTRRRMVSIFMIGADGLVPPGSHFLGTIQMPSGFITMHFFEGAT